MVSINFTSLLLLLLGLGGTWASTAAESGSASPPDTSPEYDDVLDWCDKTGAELNCIAAYLNASYPTGNVTKPELLFNATSGEDVDSMLHRAYPNYTLEDENSGWTLADYMAILWGTYDSDDEESGEYGYDWCIDNYSQEECFDYYYGGEDSNSGSDDEDSDDYGYDWCLDNYSQEDCSDYYYGGEDSNSGSDDKESDDYGYDWCIDNYSQEECFDYYYGGEGSNSAGTQSLTSLEDFCVLAATPLHDLCGWSCEKIISELGEYLEVGSLDVCTGTGMKIEDICSECAQR